MDASTNSRGRLSVQRHLHVVQECSKVGVFNRRDFSDLGVFRQL